MSGSDSRGAASPDHGERLAWDPLDLGERWFVRFILEQHLGHRSYAENLLKVASTRNDISFQHIPVTYGGATVSSKWFGRRFEGAMAGRREVRTGLSRATSDVDIYNTQVPAALAGRQLKQPYVVVSDVTPLLYDSLAVEYGHQLDRLSLVRAWKHRVNLKVFRNAALCVAWSKWAARSLVDDYDVPPHRVRVIPPGVDLGLWHRADPRDGPEGRPVEILFVGGDFHRKGGALLVDAVRRLGPRVRLTLVTGSDIANSEGVTVMRGIQPNSPEMVDLYHRADLFALPSKAEAFGIAAVEACAAGLPVVAADVGGLGDIIQDGVNGVLVPPNDLDGLTNAVDMMVKDRGRLQQMGRRSRELAVDRYDAAKNYNELIDAALESCRASES